MNIYPSQYGSWVAVTTSDTVPISCRAIYIGGAGNLTINPLAAGGTSVLFTAPPVGSIIPVELNQGRIMATGTTTTLMVAMV